ncbi:MAG: hypothetical protein CFE23_01600 [Flavobacterium sp. BFFFF1]|uniref:SCP2 sterol-binding domain-containing protein n=1 Tax=Flavobacterium sp. BFFFF1 TaxID=2015557 RepID=UPI000BD3AF9E|nr:SCP2 sterol-binding domain-containing protein [Flavobacterium sp. BFFFF1]OYU82021.1 MAG: hypothetical protein CFE23_01600 [Flavobacterium sp. BFFFF1]
MAVTPQDAATIFDIIIPEHLAQFPDKANELGGVYQLNIHDDYSQSGGEWTLDCVSYPPTCLRGTVDHANCTIAINHEDFMNIIRNRDDAMQEYFLGKLRLFGSDGELARFNDFLNIVRPES